MAPGAGNPGKPSSTQKAGELQPVGQLSRGVAKQAGAVDWLEFLCAAHR